jgi:hypothetical protein
MMSLPEWTPKKTPPPPRHCCVRLLPSDGCKPTPYCLQRACHTPLLTGCLATVVNTWHIAYSMHVTIFIRVKNVLNKRFRVMKDAFNAQNNFSWNLMVFKIITQVDFKIKRQQISEHDTVVILCVHFLTCYYPLKYFKFHCRMAYQWNGSFQSYQTAFHFPFTATPLYELFTAHPMILCLPLSLVTYIQNYESYKMIPYNIPMGARGSVVGWGITLQAGRSRVRIPMSLDFSVDLILLAALWPWGQLSL